MARALEAEDRLWQVAARLILPHYVGPRTTMCRESDITWELACWRGQVLPGHPALRLLEEYRLWRRGERGELDPNEVNVLVLKILEISLLAG